MPLTFAEASQPSIPIIVLEAAQSEDWALTQSERIQNWVRSSSFSGVIGQCLMVPSDSGLLECVLMGYGTPASRRRGRFTLAAAVCKLPEGCYHLQEGVPDADLDEQALGWLLAGYSFTKYLKKTENNVDLVAPAGIDKARIEAIAAGEVLTRDLVNTPASDMGPADLQAACCDLAERFSAQIAVISGADLLVQNLPMIHAVGCAADQAPRLIDLHWGHRGPKLTLVGKGVCFDTGGLNLKPGNSMGLMKKDMGGAANVLGLAQMIMALNLPLRLRVLIPAVENAVSSQSFRPQDILTSRKGLTVEINNTDAEGRLVLADALALGDEDSPDLMISMATLTGAARVAVGVDLAPFYTDNEALARVLATSAARVADPVWRMPFWDPYEPLIEPGIADLDNAPSGGFAGSITAALFLRRFVEKTTDYAHFDIYSWQRTAAPGRTKGGVGQGSRALLEALPQLLKL
ncbi:MAG: leucyl aminopeptidase family protein [Paracoccaceae bacterium]|nr:leucyl aminopeptidase family protein [Paracoccaceae bacterium]